MPPTEPLMPLSYLSSKEGNSEIYPFGPVLTRSKDVANNQEAVSFRLYAPTVSQVSLVLQDNPEAPQVLPMAPEGAGWFHISTEKAGIGSLYKFQVKPDLAVPDPGSRFQPQGVSGPSQVVNPQSYRWQDQEWKGYLWQETILYELHIGTFSQAGTYAGVEEHLDELVELGITAIELMPVSEFAGERNWGYDGVFSYAPTHNYGTPDELKHLVDVAHSKGLMVLLDVVYNHFGPEGNYLHTYAEDFFTDRHQSPWGAGINLDGPNSGPVREFFIQNALYWIEEFHFDGLRLDAVHTIQDDSPVPMLVELAERVQTGPGLKRNVHLILENDANRASWLHGGSDTLNHFAEKSSSQSSSGAASHSTGVQSCFPACYTAQWNDDFHHILHRLATGQTDSYYADYAKKPIDHLVRALSEGFAYQGEVSTLRNGERRGESSGHLPSTAFVSFVQNHDQVGNHPTGSRAHELTEAALLQANLTLLLLCPQIPMVFMGEEWQAAQPFPFFCDFHDELAALVTEGRRREFSHVPGFTDPEQQSKIPDPNHPSTYEMAILNWQDRELPQHKIWLTLYQYLLQLRKEVIVPWLKDGLGETRPESNVLSDKACWLRWECLSPEDQGKPCQLWMIGNWGSIPLPLQCPPNTTLLAESQTGVFEQLQAGTLSPQSVLWLVEGSLAKTPSFYREGH